MDFGVHPNLTYHVQEGTHMPDYSAEQSGGFASSLYGDVDHTPKFVALIVLAMFGLAWFLDSVGFKFAFGASVGR